MFWQRKKKKVMPYDKTAKIPVIRSSICTGEQVAGFKDKRTGQFKEILLIRTPEDRRKFLETYGIRPEELKKEY